MSAIKYVPPITACIAFFAPRFLINAPSNFRFGQAVLRCLYAYFHNLSQEDLPYIKIPLHTVIKLTPKAYGCDEERFKVPIKAVDTHRPKPKKEGGVPDSPALDPTIDHDPDGVLSKAPTTRTFFTEEAVAK